MVAVILPMLTSCSDYLDKRPDDQLDIPTSFENSNNLKRWIAYLYTGIPSCYQDSNWDLIADDMATPPQWSAAGNSVSLYLAGNWTATEGSIINYWAELPKRIRQAYVFMENAHPLEDVTQNEIDMMNAECRFFIAYFHSLMVMSYGSVPIIDEAAASTQGKDTFLKQSPFDEVVEWCVKMFDLAEEGLPVNWANADDYGRATKLWAKAMKARLLTFAASPLVNGNTELSGIVNCDGVKIFNDVYESGKWKDAVDANKELIEMAEDNGYELVEVRNGEGDIDPYMSLLYSVMWNENEGNTESIMVRTEDGVNTSGYFDSHAAPRSMGGNNAPGAIGVTQRLVDAFFMENGKVAIKGYLDDGTPDINEDSGYNENGYSTSDKVAMTGYYFNDPDGREGDQENVITEAGTFNMYCNREPRFYLSVIYNDSFHWGKTHQGSTSSDPNPKYVDFFNGGEDGLPDTDYPGYGYLLKKKIAPDYAGSSAGEFAHRHGIVYRLAEAYLSYSEALYEYSMANGTFSANEAEIYDYLNRVRRRAGIPAYGSASLPKPTPEDLRDLIHRERQVELCCESGIRWNDLRRWKEAEDVLDGAYYGMNMQAKKAVAGTRPTEADKDGFFVRTHTVDQTRKFISYWWPIPQDDIDRNPYLRQLPEW